MWASYLVQIKCFFGRTVEKFSWNLIWGKNYELFLSRPRSQTRITPFSLGLLNNKVWRHLKRQTKWMHARWIWSFLKFLIWSLFSELRKCSSLKDDVDQMHRVSVQFSTHHVYPLTCLWVKPITDDSSGLWVCTHSDFIHRSDFIY